MTSSERSGDSSPASPAQAQAEALKVIQLLVNYRQAYIARDNAEIAIRRGEYGITGAEFMATVRAQNDAEDALNCVPTDYLLRLLAQPPAATAPAEAEAISIDEYIRREGSNWQGVDAVAHVRALREDTQAMNEKAALWDALLGAARLRPLGWAGTPEDDADPVTHFGMEFWTRYPGYDHTETNTRGRQLLTSFARAALAEAGREEKA